MQATVKLVAAALRETLGVLPSTAHRSILLTFFDRAEADDIVPDFLDDLL